MAEMRKIVPGSHATDEMFGARFIRYNEDILGIPGFEHSSGSLELFCGDPKWRLYLPAPALQIVRDIELRRSIK